MISYYVAMKMKPRHGVVLNEFLNVFLLFSKRLLKLNIVHWTPQLPSSANTRNQNSEDCYHAVQKDCTISNTVNQF
jgi:hypothetical protein